MAFDSINRNVHAVISYSSFNSSTNKEETCYIFDAIKDISIKEGTTSNNRFEFGTFFKNSIEITYYTSMLEQSITWTNKKINLYFYEADTTDYLSVQDEWIQHSCYYIDSSKTTTNDNGKTYTVSGYDMPDIMSEEVDTNIGTDVQAIISTILSKSGLSFSSSSPYTDFSLSTIESILEGTTYAELLGYIAGYDGKCLRMSLSGEIEIYNHLQDSKLTITRNVQFNGEYTDSGTTTQVNALLTGSTENPIAVGSGNAIEFTNPYITEAQANNVLDEVKGFSYNTGSVRWRGNPSIQAGDVVSVETTEGSYGTFFIHEQEINYDGGLSMTSTSYTYIAEQTITGTTSPTQKKLEKIYAGLSEALQESNSLHKLFEKGGYFRILKETEDSFPYGWQITDTETITNTTKGWRWTEAGLMYSEDGFQSVSKISITMDGRLIADSVLAGSITVDSLSYDLSKTISDNTETTNANKESIKQLQDEVDGVIETWFYDYAPTDSKEPTSEWTTTEEKKKHAGDLFYDSTTGYSYRYTLQNGSYTWVQLSDSDITKALSEAQKAQEEAKSKSRIFYEEPVPPYDLGDLWVQGSTQTSEENTVSDETEEQQIGNILRCATAKVEGETFDNSDWVLASDYTGDTLAKMAQTIANKAQEDAQTANDKAQNAQDTADTASATATEANSKADSIQTQVDSVNSTISNMQTDIDSVTQNANETHALAQKQQELMDALQTQIDNLDEDKINDLLQRTTIDSTGIKISAVADSDSYILIQNDGLKVYVDGKNVANYLSDSANVAKIFFDEGKIGKHVVDIFSVDGVEGTAFFYGG